ncbi:glycine cleavage system aminomethyltransferase GcvT [Kineosporia rhizophila]|uniref:glycine cleavage system aminomethyltransferase GcvT n=1 Tax=Kineosporia TaxID=49184 RepID=UPI001E575C79|nr:MULTISPECIES: glycine cleavage system aminomethyltransferase GcvT [Kineosporia]MCE0534636.1 glycine cleavage system aminomethyltransferase GcvT [Kineosporia rhizophila]GLY15573.1 aminomethyltransferase [Kineosporia sp. NBRC 101677]
MSDRPVPRSTPLHEVHAAAGARLTDFAGWLMPLKYSSELAEHEAVRTTAGLFDLSHMGEIRLQGPEAGAALDHALVGKLSAIAPGRAKYSLLCDENGGILDDLVTYRLADDEFLVIANASNTATVLEALTTRVGGFDTRITDETEQTALIAVQGPASQAIVQALVATDAEREAVAALRYYACMPAQLAGLSVLLARTGYTGEDGFEVYVAADQAVTLWQALQPGLEAAGGRLAGLACRDTLRLEAGMPLYGNELSLQTTPYAAGLGRVAQLGKPFVGQEALARLAEEPPARVLTGLAGSGRRAARAGNTVLDAEGRPVGVITSGALSPTLGRPIALAYVDREEALAGRGLQVDVRGTHLAFEVVPYPFYKRS